MRVDLSYPKTHGVLAMIDPLVSDDNLSKRAAFVCKDDPFTSFAYVRGGSWAREYYERELHKIRLQLKFGIEALQYLGFTADVFKREMVEMYSSGVSNHIFELDKALELAFEALKKMRGADE